MKQSLQQTTTFEQLDVAWIASDDLGQIGFFFTAGSGPIPASALQLVHESEESANELPIVSDVDLLVPLPRPDDYLNLARRGFYAFDWSDVHKTNLERTKSYELIARPIKPVLVANLPPRLQLAAMATRLSGSFVRFVSFEL